ncbi:DUF3027 domain-containing protein [Nocardia lijiangensis]|uniref:DUF3027 domain-containing protein n=1 Tax=Nocardia lijiangensis TaxID=299618 RepID=UPI0009FFF3D6|nr:DUF3027 domain-containing protein [Nocardia lijiangensis]
MSAVSVSEPDVRPVLADAVDLARRALLELEPSAVGAHLGVSAEDESAATHRFEATLPGYRGWQWAVVVAAPQDADHATVSESALLPGPDALVAPDFVPWDQRIRPGDLAPGDLLAPPQDDPRLVPGYVSGGDPEVDETALEIGLGRTKVLSEDGRFAAAERWYSEYGPDTEMAKAAPSTCGKCGFYLPLAGALRAAFGVCGNAMGADGHVVHVEYGCGAHSDVVAPTGGGSPLYEAFDDAAFDVISPEELGKSAVRADRVSGDEAGSAESADATRTAVADTEAGTPAETAAIATEPSAEVRAEEIVTADSSAEAAVARDEQATIEDEAEAPGIEQADAQSAAVAESVTAEPHLDAVADASAAESAVAADATSAAEPSAVTETAADAAPVAEPSAVTETAAESSVVKSEAGEVQPSASDDDAAAEPDADAPVNGIAAEQGSAPDAQARADEDGQSRPESGSSPRN